MTTTTDQHRAPAAPFRDAVATIREVVTALGTNPLGGYRARLRTTANRLEAIVTLEQRIDAARDVLTGQVPEWGEITRGQVLDVIDRLDDGAAPLDAGCAIDPDLDMCRDTDKRRVVTAVDEAGRAARGEQR